MAALDVVVIIGKQNHFVCRKCENKCVAFHIAILLFYCLAILDHAAGR